MPCVFPRTLFLSALLATSPLLAEAPKPVADLPEKLLPGLAPLLEQAQRASPRLAGADLDVQIAQGGVTVADARRKPTASAQFQGVYRVEDRENQSKTSREAKLFYAVNLSQPLYHWGALRANSNIARLQESNARGDRLESRRQLLLAVRAQYFDLILAKMARRNARFAHERAQALFQVQKQKYESKELSGHSWDGAQLAWREAQLALRLAETQYARVRQSLSDLLGGEALDEAAVPEGIPAFQPDPAFGGVALEGDRSLSGQGLQRDRLQRQVAMENLGEKITRRRTWPKFNAVASFSRNQVPTVGAERSNLSSDVGYIGVEMNWTVFDGFERSGLLEQTLARRRKLEIQQARLDEDQRREAATLRENLALAAEGLAIVETRLHWAEGGMLIVKSDIARGRASEAQEIEMRASLYAAEEAACRKRADYLESLAGYVSLVQGDPALVRQP